ncbi:carboxymuconolactone decarboxylase family protein [Rhodococcus sp. IEGM 1379]|uniref:carboxymuconolactone decarboxylase family protein n=1 Tax=Rhodococcus sp. IEGM 1379 TaxID=3047086 RepID=UPI0024B64B3A|nr:carboxymuconolactone decarboxylase family protein [Rhodococcus sp. IEGM 1379]MDI9919200.1 carboxymuconolactone decarboxylase family protein [Rhodococcus sp. IEGM 1379]
MNPRIQPGRFRDLGPINWGIWRVLSTAAGAPDAHLFSTLGRAGGLFRGWLHYSGSLMPGGKISRHDTELIILRVAHLRECQYEMDHHIRLGRKAGIDAPELARIFEGPNASDLSSRHRAILTAVDELVASKDISDKTWTTLSQHFDDRRLIEFTLLVTQYDGLATTIGTLRVQRDFT